MCGRPKGVFLALAATRHIIMDKGTCILKVAWTSTHGEVPLALCRHPVCLAVMDGLNVEEVLVSPKHRFLRETPLYILSDELPHGRPPLASCPMDMVGFRLNFSPSQES